MKKTLVFVFCLLWGSLGTLALAAERSDMGRSLQRMALTAASEKFLELEKGRQAPSAGFGAGPLVIVVVPEFHYSHHGAILGNVGNGVVLKSRSGHSQTGSVVFTATKPLTDLFSLGFFYQYAYGSYSGGLMTPDLPNLDGHSEVNVNAHVVGLLGNFNLGSYGRLETSVLQAFDSYSGQGTMLNNGVPALTRSYTGTSDRVTSLMAFYVNDIPVSESLTLSPYLGWRTVYVVLANQIDWQDPIAHLPNSDAWAHLLSGGLKATYSAGPWTLYGRLGTNYRVSRSDIPGFSSRAVSPGIAHLGWMTSWARTIGTWGIGFSYTIPEVGILDVGYNGFAGQDVGVHSLSVTAIFPF
jgi:hypothetical protein